MRFFYYGQANNDKVKGIIEAASYDEMLPVLLQWHKIKYKHIEAKG